MRALSLWQPWASLWAIGVKVHETRHWPTDHRGPLAIHAAQYRVTREEIDELTITLASRVFGRNWRDHLPYGAFVGTCDLVGCYRITRNIKPDTSADLVAGNWAVGRYAWRAECFRPLPIPLPGPGRQQFFFIRAAVILQARARARVRA